MKEIEVTKITLIVNEFACGIGRVEVAFLSDWAFNYWFRFLSLMWDSLNGVHVVLIVKWRLSIGYASTLDVFM